MATGKEYLAFVLDQLSALEGLSHRPMMGEYVLYYDGKVVGGIYDDRLLLKPAEPALTLLREAGREVCLDIPYAGAKEMLLADIDDPDLCCRLIRKIEEALPVPKKRR